MKLFKVEAKLADEILDNFYVIAESIEVARFIAKDQYINVLKVTRVTKELSVVA